METNTQILATLLIVMVASLAVGFIYSLTAGRQGKSEDGRMRALLGDSLRSCVGKRARDAATIGVLRAALGDAVVLLWMLADKEGPEPVHVRSAAAEVLRKVDHALNWPWAEARCSTCINGPVGVCPYLKNCRPGPGSNYWPKGNGGAA